MSIKATDLVLGSCIKLKEKIWKVVSKNHVKPGKGGAYIQASLKSTDGTKLEHRFSSSDTIDTVMMEKKKYQYSYTEKNIVSLISLSDYSSLEISSDIISENSMMLLTKFSDENTIVEVEFADDNILDVTMPANIIVKIEFADPVVKGQTAASSYKNAIIKNDISIGVPSYVNTGDSIVINLYGEKGIEFVSRAS